MKNTLLLARSSKYESLQKYFLFGILFLLLSVLFYFFSSFFTTLFIATVLSIAVWPVQTFFVKKLKIFPIIATFLTMGLLFVLFLFPVFVLFYFLFSQADFIFEQVNNTLSSLMKQDFSFPHFDNYPMIQHFLDGMGMTGSFSTKETLAVFSNFLGETAGVFLNFSTTLLKNISLFVLHSVMFVLALFYFLRDGSKFVGYVQSLLPISETNQEKLFSRMYYMMRSITWGLFAAAIAQGTTLLLGLTLAGVPNPLFWASLGALLSPLPYVGAGLVWGPATVFLFATGQNGAGFFLLLWCLIIVTNIDNVVKPYIMGRSVHLHPFAVMLALFGGAFAFGFQGLLVGPFLLLLTVSFLEIYRGEFQLILRRASDPLPLQTKEEVQKRNAHISRTFSFYPQKKKNVS